MRRLSLGTLLAALNASLVLATAAAVGAVGVLLLHRLADEQALARVELAGEAALEEVAAAGGAVERAVSLLAERPTLNRLLAGGEARELVAFLERFRATGGLSGCAVFHRGELVAASPPADAPPGEGLPWTGIRAAGAAPGGLIPEPGNAGRLLLVSAAPTLAPDGEAMAVRRVDEAFHRRLAERTGLPVRVLAAGEVGPGPGEPAGRHLEKLAGSGDYRALYPYPDPDSDSYPDPGGRPSAWVETVLPGAGVQASVAGFLRSFALSSLAAAGLALAAGLFLGRRIARPARLLEQAAGRLGAGDLSTPVPAASGSEMGSLSATLEETRRRLQSLTAELRRREAEAQAILGGIVEGVFAVDSARRVRYLNPQAARFLGLSPREAVGRFCGDLLRPRTEEGTRPCDQDCPIIHARSRGITRAVEHLELPGGERTMVITSAPPAEERQVQVMRAETEDEAGRRVRDAILANLSHELKSPLAAQLASLELLQDGLESLEPAAARELVTSLERSTLRLTRLIDNLLASVRLETGEWRERRQAVDPAEAAREAAALLAPLFAQRRQELVWELAEPLPGLSADPTQLTQVLVNLLANANKFAPEGSTVRVGAEARPGGVALWVEDEGPGVPAGEESTLFERFRRAGREEAPGAGLGLGLWLVKSIVQRHGGTVTAGNRPGGGARFTFFLPAGEEDAA